MMRVLLIGHSHIHAIDDAIKKNYADDVTSALVPLNRLEVAARSTPGQSTADLIPEAIAAAVKSLLGLDRLPLYNVHKVCRDAGIVTIASVGGNAPNTLGLLQIGAPFDFAVPGDPAPLLVDRERLEYSAVLDMFTARGKGYFDQIDAICRIVQNDVFFVEAPPVKSDEAYLEANLDTYFRDILKGRRPNFNPPSVRLKLWRANAVAFRQAAEKAGATYVEAPAAGRDDEGFLAPRAYHDATHANAWYGALVFEEVRRLAEARLGAAAPGKAGGKRRKGVTPYATQPTRAFWKQSISDLPSSEVDPVEPTALKLDKRTRVVTAGSCFAQHIARSLKANGYNYHVTEKAHALLDADTAAAFNYGTFSARYGNIYTSRQLDQLFDRAFGGFTPVDSVWEQGGTYVDPFRPRIQPGGFASVEALTASRDVHFAAVRRALRELDVFVFTLGLTECWASRVDGAVFPLCPGTAGGVFDDDKYRFVNLTVDEVVADMTSFLGKLRRVNARSKVLLTVSPVPLVATATEGHVLNATTYSKAVLRVAAERLRALPNVFYFPSFEIITGSFSRGRYYAPDAREVEEAGVKHVMSLFLKHFTDAAPKPAAVEAVQTAEPDADDPEALKKKMDRIMQTICDEEALAR